MLLKTCVILCLFGYIVSPPPNRKPSVEQAASAPSNVEHENSNATVDETNKQQVYNFPYSKYLELVVQILEAQPKFRERIRQLQEDDIKSGKIADHIDDLGHEVFDQLTKVKIDEINRLQEEFKAHLEKGNDASKFLLPEHLDLNNQIQFSKEDLRKLIIKTVADMNEIDAKRRMEFKKYEMEKQAIEAHKLAQMSEEERAKAKQELEEQKKRHNEHEALKHPGGRDQLEEVWEERDKMDKDSFDPKTFFMMHDLDGDGKWNHEEIEALFQKELEKVYNESNPEDDMREKIEEMHRMREHVVKQIDKDNDSFISLDEFLQDPEVQANDNKDEGWDDLSKQTLYTEEELKKFEEEYAKQRGWGDHAYDGAQTLSPHASTPQEQYHEQQQNQQQSPPPINGQQPPPPPPAQQQVHPPVQNNAI